ncbi:MAG TPA: rod shape-determining protein MreC [Candidatus Hydrogenedentes bacterium]|nr:rod shape-determining protein MreC [Candidatus Hydrogenedentota bacterium]
MTGFLLRMLSEHRPKVVFAVLVILSVISLLVGSQGSLVQRGLYRVVSAISYPFLVGREVASGAGKWAWGLVAGYAELESEREALREQLTVSRAAAARTRELEAENRALRDALRFIQETPELVLEPARVLERYKGMLRIDRGARHGIRPGMGVIAPEGVVGIVSETADFMSTVATLHHMDCRVGAMVLRNRLRAYDGVIHPAGTDLSGLCTMEYIDMKEEVRVGDLVVTSPESVFPAGLPIGRISAVNSVEGSLYKNAEVTVFTDPYRLDMVFLVRRSVDDPFWLAGPAADYLDLYESAQSATGEAVAEGVPNPDTRPLQERLAP